MANELDIDNLPDDGAILSIVGRGIVLAAGDSVPADATAGYAPGCLFIHIDGTNSMSVLYCNISTKDSCDFENIEVA